MKTLINRWTMLAMIASCRLLWGEGTPVQDTPPKYIVRKWTTANGLPQNWIRYLLQSHDGYLWICTPAGLARFDGVRFTIFNRENTPEMRSDNCVCLAEDRERSLWIGTENGLLRLKEGRFTAIPAGDQLLSGQDIRCLNIGRDGGLWIGTAKGLDLYKKGKLSHFMDDKGLSAKDVRSVLQDARGELWVGTDVSEGEGGLQKLDTNRNQFIGFPISETSLLRMTHSLLEDRLGIVWWGDNDGLHSYRPNHPSESRSFSVKDGLRGSVVKWLSLTTDGGLLLALGQRQGLPGARGLQLFRDGFFRGIPLADHGIEDDVICAIEDREGSLWVGTRHDGLIQLRPQQVTIFDTRDGLSSDNILSICAPLPNRVVAGTQGGLNEIRDARGIFYPSGAADGNLFHSVFMSPEGRLFAGGTGRVVGNFLPGGGRRTAASIEGDFPNPNIEINAIYGSTGGQIYLGFNQGAARIKWVPNTYKVFNIPETTGIDTRCLLEDRAGHLWLGSEGLGLVCLDGGKIKKLDASQGLSNPYVWALLEDSEGTLWVGTRGGLFRYKDERFLPVIFGEGRAQERIHSILEDDFGYFWISSLHGIRRVSRRELDGFLDGRTKFFHSSLFDEFDGMPTSETSSGRQPVSWKAPDGRLWFATPKGVVAIDPTRMVENTNLPPIVIEQVRSDEEVIFGDGIESLKPDAAKLAAGRGELLEFRFSANSFATPEKVRFKYWLHGHDKTWREPDDRERVARYTNLRPGNYEFHVIACNNHGYWNAEGASFAFSLAPRFTQTFWFPVSVAAGGLALAAAFTIWRLRWQQRVLLARQTAALESERARIARDLHDDLGTNLTGLALQVDVARGELSDSNALEKRLIGVARDARVLVDQMREAVWMADPQCDTLESFATHIGHFAESFLGAAGLSCRLNFPESIPASFMSAEIRHALFLVVKEALHNVIKHADATEARLCLVLEAGILILAVEDNGKGAISNFVAGHGIGNMRQRLRSLGGEFEWHSKAGVGTRVCGRLPLEKSR